MLVLPRAWFKFTFFYFPCDALESSYHRRAKPFAWLGWIHYLSFGRGKVKKKRVVYSLGPRDGRTNEPEAPFDDKSNDTHTSFSLSFVMDQCDCCFFPFATFLSIGKSFPNENLYSRARPQRESNGSRLSIGLSSSWNSSFYLHSFNCLFVSASRFVFVRRQKQQVSLISNYASGISSELMTPCVSHPQGSTKSLSLSIQSLI